MQSRIWAAAIALSVAATSAFGAISNTVTIGTQTVTETVGVNWTQTATLIGAQPVWGSHDPAHPWPADHQGPSYDPFTPAVWTGAPDEVYTGIGDQTVIMDFGAPAGGQIAHHVSQTGITLKDLYVYEYPFGFPGATDVGSPEFNLITVKVGNTLGTNGLLTDGIDITASAVQPSAGDPIQSGDETAPDPAYIRGYTAPLTGHYRFLEIIGSSPYGYPAGLNYGMDLDAAGAVQLISVTSGAPEPASLGLLALPLLLSLARKRVRPVR